MLIKLFTLSIVILLIPFMLYAQSSDKYLISVDVDQDMPGDFLETLDLSVYHVFGKTLIAGASDDKIKNLGRSGILFQLLDEYPESNKYYILTNKNATLQKSMINNDIIYDGGESLLIKDDHPNIENFVSLGFTCVEMKKHSKNFEREVLIKKHKIASSLDSTISNVLVQINVDSVEHYVQSLQDFGTRFLFADTKDSVASWIQDQFEKMGYSDVVLDEFWNEATSTWQKNVVATIPGSRDTESIYVVGGHHDSYSSGDPFTYAPGADDNASGTTAVLEIARAIKKSGYQPEATFKFITFAAEEYGLFGSFDFAEKAFQSGMNIKLMINHDMISHTNSVVTSSSVDINYYSGWDEFRDLAVNNTEKYSLLNPVFGTQNSAGSDSYSFWVYGFPAVYFEEHDFSPYYHSPADIIDNYSMAYCTEVIKASCATLISASVVPSRIENFKIVDIGDGNSLLLNWSPSGESDVSGYHIYLGTISGIYDTVYTTTDTSLLIDNLTDEMSYYIGITAFDQDTFESIVVEKSAVPRTIPLNPSLVRAEAQWQAVELTWAPNLEFDLVGYNIYRSADTTGAAVKLNESLIVDTSFTDTTPENSIYYYYVITANDQSENESSASEIVRSRGVSLDGGILVVDETRDDTGAILRPTDEEVDEFYASVLKRFLKDNFDIIEEGGVDLADLGAYSTIIWHGDDRFDFSVPQENQAEIQKYLEYGGNFIYSGYTPSTAFEVDLQYPSDFSSGDFLYDYFKIQHVENQFGSRFIGAIPAEEGFQPIYVDSTKAPESTNYHIPSIEGISAGPGGMEIYYYDTYFDTSTAAGSMKNQSVGVAYFGEDYQSVILSFPLYIMQLDQAKELMRYILNEKFNEPLSLNDKDDLTISEFRLLQNYPNPFNPTTIINYELQITNDVDLSIYNLLGQKVATLVDTRQDAGYHQVEWNASGFSSGVYFYSLQSGDYKDVKKMVLLR